MFLQIGNDAVDLADHRVEPLRVRADGLPRFARAAITAADVEHAPVSVAGPRRRVEDEIAERVNAGVELDTQQFACGSLERAVGDVGIGPFDEHAIAQDLAGRRDGLRRLVAAHVEAGRARGVGRRRRIDRRVFDVHRVEPAVLPVIRIELHAHEAVGIAGLVREAVEQSGATFAAVEIEIDRELLRRFVEDVQRAVEIVNEEPVRAAGLLAQSVRARQHPVRLAFAVELSRDRQFQIVLHLEHQRRHARRRP